MAKLQQKSHGETQINMQFIKNHLQLQDRLNSKIDPQWYTRNRSWERAITVEAVEAIEHHHWKWWKKPEPNMPQLQIELVDIWHFILSRFLEEAYLSRGPELAHEEALTDLEMTLPTDSIVEGPLLERLDGLAGSAAQGYIDLYDFVCAVELSGMTWEQLNVMYVCKNVLNIFRQDHGYKDGTYIKEWYGLEDNVYLENILEATPDATPDEILAKLEEWYNAVLTDKGE